MWNCVATPTAIWCPSSSIRCASRAGAARISASYGCYLDDRRPDWDSILPGHEDKLYTLIVLNKPAACPPVRRFDYDALCARFHKVLHLRRGFYDRYSHFGFLFTETPAHDRAELDAIVRDDLLGFVIPEDSEETPQAQ